MSTLSIRKLPTQVINQIAAGEVVERPASVLKELIENALDAGADHIKVTIEDGGRKLIEVWDNGSGIKKDDLPLTIERYSTSKLKVLNDLNKLQSYGFRGEALAAISSVSHVEIFSKHPKQELTYKLTSDKKAHTKIEEAESRPQGSTIRVVDLFSEIPVRLKFLKSPQTENRHLTKIFFDFALINPAVHFELYRDGRQVYNFITNTNQAQASSDSWSKAWLERISQLLNIDEELLLRIDYEQPSFTIQGFIVKPESGYKGTTTQKIFVNNRPIIDKGILRAVYQAVENYTVSGYKPTFVISIKVDPKIIDVNVHPRKTEVKFHNPYRVFSSVTKAIEKTFSQETIDTNKMKLSDIEAKYGSDKGRAFKQLQDKKQTITENVWSQKMDNAVSRLRQKDDSYKPFVSRDLWSQDEDEEQDKIGSNLKSILLSKQDDILKIRQLLRRYILVELSREIWIIDQHAAAERIRYEKLWTNIDKAKPERQGFVLSNKIKLSSLETELIKRFDSIIKALGFDYQLKEKEILIKSGPVILVKGDMEAIFRDLLDQLNEINEIIDSDETEITLDTIKDFKLIEQLKNIIATISCHNSIRANQNVSKVDLKSIISDLLACDVPYACPHGRKLIWILSQEEIDKQFMR